MARKTRITEIGQYHIINRGVERRDIFLEADDYEKFLDLLSQAKEKFHLTIHNFSLMTNHYHILLETSKPNISDAIKYLNSHYSLYFNKKYKRIGHLWQGRFHSYLLYDDTHFWIVAKIVKEINHYRYQSFFQWR